MQLFLPLLVIGLVMNVGPALADFYVYRGLQQEYNGGPVGTEKTAWFMFEGRVGEYPDCNQVKDTKNYDDRWDVSGNKKGVACDGRCYDSHSPTDITRIEMNADFGHYTFYRSRDYGLYDINDKWVGQCWPTTEDTFECLYDIGGVTYREGRTRIWCSTDAWGPHD